MLPTDITHHIKDNAPERLATRTIQPMFSPEPKQHQATECDEASQDNSVPSLLCTNPLHEPIDAGYLCSGSCDPPLNAAETFSLQCEALIHGIRLAEY